MRGPALCGLAELKDEIVDDVVEVIVDLVGHDGDALFHLILHSCGR